MISKLTTWKGIQAVELTSATYRAVVLPEYGANCIELVHLPTQTRIFRSPASVQALDEAPVVYGLPILFPPNRICDGTYSFNGTTYSFPINEPLRNHHIHGTLCSTQFIYQGEGEFSFSATLQEPYLQFPHPFTMLRNYELTDDGLKHTITVINDGDTPMPLGVGVHSTLNVPSEDFKLRIPAQKEWLMNERFIPTEEFVADSFWIEALQNGSVMPEQTELCSLLEVDGCTGYLYDETRKIFFQHDVAFPFVMLWNNHGGKGFVCPEPQSWLVDAPNLKLPPEISGFHVLAP